ncbi:MAG: DUF4288 domain-containing protein [Nitrospinota bacterium]
MVKWFGVKTVYMTTARGKARLPEVDFEPSSVMVEERVLTFKARNIDSAIKRAEREAKEYASKASGYINPYGQTVTTRYYCYEYFEFWHGDEPGEGIEVYSSTEIRLTRPTKAELESSKIGLKHGKREASLRRKFSDRDLSKPEK